MPEDFDTIEDLDDNSFDSPETADANSPYIDANDDSTTNDQQKDKSVRSSLSSAWEEAETGVSKKDLDQKGERGDATIPPIAQSTFKAPRSWSKEASEWLTSQPKTLEEAIELRKKIAEYAAKRQEEQDADYTSKTQEIAKAREAFQREAQNYQEIFRTFQPKMRDFYLRGVNPHQWLNEVFELEKLAKENPKAALLHLSRQWGVNPQDIIQAQQQHQSMIPPELENTLKVQQQEIMRMKQALQAQEQAKVLQLNRENEQAVMNFRSAVDESGNPRFPHIDKVLNEMIPFVQNLKRNNPSMSHNDILAESYDRAVWANKELRAELLAQQQRQEAAKRVVEAKKAASPVTSNPNGHVISGANSLRDALSAAWDEHARV